MLWASFFLSNVGYVGSWITKFFPFIFLRAWFTVAKQLEIMKHNDINN
jgi:hypothetical protein